MLRSLMTAVTGVRAHQTMLDVTGNNISNANTTGFKKDNTIFADLMYQASKYASSADGSRGGINPAQVGLGVSVGAIETIHTQGSSQYTGNASDMMIQERGFFVYTDGTNQLFSRSGACTLDGNSDLVQSGSGYKLQGYKMEETALEGFQQAADLSTINIPLGQKMEAKKTTRVDYQCNLDSRQGNFLKYGFADLPYNAVAGADGLSSDQAKVPMNGTEYDVTFTTSFDGNANNDTTGVHYLTFSMANSGQRTDFTFDMTNIDTENGIPKLSLPRLNRVLADTEETQTGSTYSGTLGENGFMGYIRLDNPTTANILDTEAKITAITADSDKYAPIYQIPGQVPAQYAVAVYDDDTGMLSLRKISLISDADDDTNGKEVPTTSGGTFPGNLNVANTHIRLDPSMFTYNVKGDMDYTCFKLEGSPTVPTDNDAYAPSKVSYNFLVEFDESVSVTFNDDATIERGTDVSELGKTISKMTLWYYGYSNADAETLANATAEQIEEGTVQGAPKAMHKLEAYVSFNADGSFDVVNWADATNDNAPLGYRIVNGTLLGAAADATPQGPNLFIAPSKASNASTKSDALNFMQAQNLDTPSSTDQLGSWNTIGTTAQGGFHATKATIYDDDGKTHTLEVTYKKITENRWRWEAFIVEQDEQGNDIISNIVPEPRTGEIEFDGSGKINNAIADGDLRSTGNAEVTITVPFSLNGQPNSDIVLNFGGGGDALLGVTQFASETTTKPVYQDGYTMGILKNYSVAANGTITGSYSNGISIPLYRVALATFANEQGLEKVGNTMFQASVNSGTANIDGAGSNGKGTIMGQYVEMSNVDLTEEFTHLIIAQRGFQANTRVVTVSDQILEEVVNLKR